ncbi:head GIN domain-containing protein [Ichthyenterobacterium sp. W332]|uniref:Head GIN domain-containing protein n=1 Tax=Microcosmobacter mediterraneus TaxID=3075607 RepID=A0ABU2YLT1_9FLAO|nr:head GIN domain-containing protein [Ichthyenterobacterium sp. W332]MDT0559118.1 head GIN domain-containing protein [Ichthyenterobacterium sp. W332]
MTTLTKIIISILLGFLVTSCNMDFRIGQGVIGNGNVITKERSVEGSFNAIQASSGIDLYLTQGNSTSVIVEADENLHDIIITEVENNTLKVYLDENVKRSKSQKVMLTFKDVSSIKSTSGSDVYSTNTIKTKTLNLKSTSGSDLELSVNAETIDCKSTSGSDMKLSGTVDYLIAEATSGSDIKAGDLKAMSSKVKATSGADITVNTSKELVAKATSGGDVKYYGNPEKVEKTDGVSGSISKR